jgi:hypothetical protein
MKHVGLGLEALVHEYDHTIYNTFIRWPVVRGVEGAGSHPGTIQYLTLSFTRKENKPFLGKDQLLYIR